MVAPTDFMDTCSNTSLARAGVLFGILSALAAHHAAHRLVCALTTALTTAALTACFAVNQSGNRISYVDTALDTKRKPGAVAGRFVGQVGSDPFHSAGAALGLLRENPAANLRGVGQRQQQKTRRSGRAVGQISNPAKMEWPRCAANLLLTLC